MEPEWYCTEDGEEVGPMTREELQQRADSRKLLPDDLVWRTGLSDWRPAKSVKGLFKSLSGQPRSQAKEPTPSAERLLDRAEAFAGGIGQAASEAFNPGGFDEILQLSGKDDDPAIFLQKEYFGGRTQIGASIKSLQTTGAQFGAAIFSWFYLFTFLRSLASGWEFLPFAKTEFVRITLHQRLMWRRISPVFVSWLIIILVISLVLTFLGFLLNEGRGMLGDRLVNFILGIEPLLFFMGYVVANLMACRQLVDLGDDSLHRSMTTLEYGFPHKYRLLSGLSDAPVEQQIQGVLKLCEAVGRVDFSHWDQFSTHGQDGGLVPSILSRVMRR